MTNRCYKVKSKTSRIKPEPAVLGTRIIEEKYQKLYEIEGTERDDLIPIEAEHALVSYNNEGQPISIFFSISQMSEDIAYEPFNTYEERVDKYVKKKKELQEKINPKRTIEEVVKIDNALKKALE